MSRRSSTSTRQLAFLKSAIRFFSFLCAVLPANGQTLTSFNVINGNLGPQSRFQANLPPAITTQNPGIEFYVSNLPACSNLRYRYFRPDDTIAFDSGAFQIIPQGSSTCNPFYPTSYWLYYWTVDLAVAGVWRIVIDLNGAPFINAEFAVFAVINDALESQNTFGTNSAGVLPFSSGPPGVGVQFPVPNIPACSTVRLRYQRPDTSIAFDSGAFGFGGSTCNPAMAVSMWVWYWFIYLNQPGIWHILVDLNGTPYIDARFNVFDATPPTLTPQITGTSGNNGWYRSNVSVAWIVSDPESGIASSTGCTQSTLSAETGGVTLTCRATNGAGLSNAVSVTIKIDKAPPVTSGMPAAGCSISPPNKKLVQVGVVSATDVLSGLAVASFKVTATSNEPSDPKISSVAITPNSRGGFVVQLLADRDGKGAGRIYTITATANDQAGNTVTNTATCTVPHDQGQ